ncbi:MAG: PHP domain-containing protein [Deltaproteobacteria bacterium]|nr:PHP domain-containing protein [Deltaproteobacteria bacterium]
MASRLLVPLFSTSATAVLTHFSEGDGYAEETLPDGTKRMRDAIRSYTFERYLAVGDGDVASAVRVAYGIRGTAHGDVEGVVFENGSMNPIVGADVFALADPRTDPAAPAPATYREYRKLAQAAWGHSGVMSQMETDVGVMPSWTGEFSGPLPPGAYFLVARTPDRGLSPLVPVTIAEGRTTVAHLSLPAAGRIEYRVQDQGGMASPARITFVRTDAAGDDLDWDGSNEPELGDPRYDHGIVKHEFTMNGHGAVGVPPGEYDVVASRGIEFGVAGAHVEVRPGANAPVHLVLAREVDTAGWVSADLHVHSGASVDSGLPQSLRVKAAVAEGLEFFAATDHDYVSWFLAHVLRLGVEQFLKVMPGVETSPLEYGHFNGFPMAYDDTKWPNRDAPPWPGRRLGDVWQEMRERSSAPADTFVVEVNHPRDGMMGYFGQIGMAGYSLERKTPGMETCAAPLERAPCDFEAFELLNGKNFQYLHTPTVVEEADYYRCMSAIIASRNAADFPQKDGAGGLCADLQKGPAGCDAAKAAAAAADRTGPVDDATAAAVVLADHCRWHEAFRAEMARCGSATLLDCKRIALEALKYLSVRYMVERTPSENDRYFETTAATDIGCSLEDACTECVCAAHPECCQDPPAEGETGTGTGWTPACEAACRAECPASLDRPCTSRFQPVEDWFAFLDAGFDKAVVANSDSHGLQKEIGLPRNFVASPTDSPFAIDANELTRAVRAKRVILSSGPFLDFEVAGASGASAGPGQTLDASGGGDLTARLVIRTPSWFKVDRVEIYRNSKLEKRIFPDRPKEEVVDLDATIALGRPAEDSWYVVFAYGLNDPDQLSPVYKREAYGNILISTIISLAAQQILSSFGSVLDAIGGADAIGQLLGGVELPDSFPNLPWATTNAIKVDVDGGGWRPPKARVAADGSFELPPFCTRPCAPQAGPDGAPTRTTCGENQVCIPDTASPRGGMCGIPVPKGCVGLQKSGV